MSEYRSILYFPHRGLLLYLWLVSMLSIIDIPTSVIYGWSALRQGVYLAAVGLFKAEVVYTVISFLCGSRLKVAVRYAILALYTFLAVVNALCYGLYEMGISRKMLTVVIQTNPRESAEFLSNLLSGIGRLVLSRQALVAAVAAAAVCFLICRLPVRVYRFAVCGTGCVGLVLLAAFCISNSSGRTAHSLALRMVKYSREIYLAEKEYRRLLAEATEFPDAQTVATAGLADNVLVVIGESASRGHHSLYGYPLPTTPRLDSLSSKLFLFTDAIGSSASTAGNMERILTFKHDDETFGDGLKYPAVVDLFNTAGYKTYWLSNQERSGSVSNSSSVLVRNAAVTRYLGPENSEDALITRYDEVLLPAVSEALADRDTGRRMVFAHLIGSHVDYKYRYPAGRGRFSAEDEMRTGERPWLNAESAGVVARYDNSIAYTDSVLSEMIRMLESDYRPSALLYFSDHGENVYDTGNMQGRGEKFVEVPFIVYVNEAYRRRNPDVVRCLEGALAKPFSTANVVHLLMHLTGTGYAAYDATRDPLSQAYRIRPRYVDEKIWQYEKQ